ncbi:Integrin, partial [Fasciola gigantica]
ILNSPDSQPGDGFGIGLARGIDIDSDGWPELFVTSLQSSSRATYVYSMPHRLRAQCHISVPPVYGFAPFQVGSKIPVTITIRLFDLHKSNWVPIPAGVSSSETRLHQINPDISWQERYVNRTSGSSHNSIDGKDADSFFASLVNKGLDLTRPRFTLAGDRITSITVNNGGTQMLVRFSLEAQYAAQSVDLSAIPLRVGYRSHMSSATCPFFHVGNRLCIKSEQPLIDWSSCTGQIELDRHICVPDPQCLADVTVEKLTPRVDAPGQELEFGNSKTRQQLVRFRLTNRGPTKSTGVGVQLRVLGRWGTRRPVGVQLAITQVVVDKNNQGKTGDKIWSANIAEDGSAALISSKPHYWFYPTESIQFNVSLFAEGLREMVNLPQEQWDLHIANISSVNPGLSIRVASAVTDPSPDNDEQFVHYNLTYKPRVEISAGVQPTTIIDNRKTATVTESKPPMSKVFSHEIGPRVDHMFLIENRGQTTLHNLTLVLDLPIETADGKLLLYLTDRARRLSTAGTATQWETMLPHLVGANGQNLGDCVLPREYTNQFGFSILEYEPERHRVKRSATAGTYVRSKTPTEDDVTIQRLDDPESEVHMDIPLASSAYPRRVQHGNTAFARAERGRIYLRCPPFSRTQSTTNTSALSNWHKCVEIRCNVARLEKSDTVRLRWTGWLWAATYFALHTPDVQLTSRLRVANWGQPPESVRFYQLLTDYQQTSQTRLSDLIQFDYPDPAPVFEMKQSIIFYNVHPDVIHQVPWWPIVVGVVVGSLLLAALGICCYCCGFFRRKRIPSKVEAKMHARGIRSSSKDRLLSSNGDEPDNKGKSGVPSFLSTKPRTETAISAVPSSKSVSERRVKIHRKAPDQTEFLVQASPNLLCAEEPEPPSPKIPRSYTAPPDWEVEDDEREGIENWQGTGVSFPAENDPTEPESDAHTRSLQQLPVTKADQHTEAELPGNVFAQQRAGEKPDTGQTTDAKEPSESEENSNLKQDEFGEEQVKVSSTDDENSKINKNDIMDS